MYMVFSYIFKVTNLYIYPCSYLICWNSTVTTVYTSYIFLHYITTSFIYIYKCIYKMLKNLHWKSLSVVPSLTAWRRSRAAWPPRDTSIQITSGTCVSQKGKWRLSDGSLECCCGLLWPRAGVSSLLLLLDTASSQVTAAPRF